MGKICAFLSAGSSEPTALVITGDSGIGKTVVWNHLVKTALPPSFRVLSSGQPRLRDRSLSPHLAICWATLPRSFFPGSRNIEDEP